VPFDVNARRQPDAIYDKSWTVVSGSLESAAQRDFQLKGLPMNEQLDNKPSLLTRFARPDEWRTIQALNLQIFEFELETCEPTSNLAYPFSPEGEEYFMKAAEQRDDHAAIVAELDGVVVGYAIVKTIPPSDLTHRVGVIQYQLHTLSVDKSHRDKGIGAVLVDAAKAFAKKRGANRIKVTAYAPNERAAHLYKKKGFIELEITYEATL